MDKKKKNEEQKAGLADEDKPLRGPNSRAHDITQGIAFRT